MEQKLEELAAKIDELLARVEALENRLDEKEAEETAEEAAAEEAAAETPEQAAGAPDIAEFTKRLAKKVAPADRKPYVAHYERLSGDARAKFEEFVGNLPDAAELGEYGRRAGGGEPDDQEARIRKYCAEHGLDMGQANHYAKAAMAVCEYVKPE